MVPRREQRRCHRHRRATARSPSTGIIANGFESAPLAFVAGGAGFCVGEGVRTRFQDFRRAPGQKPRSRGLREGIWCRAGGSVHQIPGFREGAWAKDQVAGWAGRNVVSLQPSECQRTQPLFRDLGFCRIWQMELRPLALLRGGAHQIPGFGKAPGQKPRSPQRPKGMWCTGNAQATHRRAESKEKGPHASSEGALKNPITSGRRCGRPRVRWRSSSWRRGLR